MQELIEGVHRFRREEFGEYRELFQRLSREGQSPHTLFITCSDSRVLAELITQSEPGDLFVVKNVGNLVPPPDAASPSSTSAAIEYAVEVLEVEDIVVCGHSQCGAMSALLEDAPPELPHLARWLELAAPVRALVDERYGHLEMKERALAAARENVLFALESLRSHPPVARRLAAGTLRLHGWFFRIAGAELFAYDPASRRFERLGGMDPLTGD